MNVSYRHQMTFFGMLTGAVAGGLLALYWLDNLSGRDEHQSLSSPVQHTDLARIAGDTYSLIREITALLAERRD